jgi:hypothetical protein
LIFGIKAIWFAPTAGQKSVFTVKEKGSRYFIVPIATIPSHRSKALSLKKPILTYANGLK